MLASSPLRILALGSWQHDEGHVTGKWTGGQLDCHLAAGRTGRQLGFDAPNGIYGLRPAHRDSIFSVRPMI
jgi:hypothetical protein